MSTEKRKDLVFSYIGTFTGCHCGLTGGSNALISSMSMNWSPKSQISQLLVKTHSKKRQVVRVITNAPVLIFCCNSILY